MKLDDDKKKILIKLSNKKTENHLHTKLFKNYNISVFQCYISCNKTNVLSKYRKVLQSVLNRRKLNEYYQLNNI